MCRQRTRFGATICVGIVCGERRPMRAACRLSRLGREDGSWLRTYTHKSGSKEKGRHPVNRSNRVLTARERA